MRILSAILALLLLVGPLEAADRFTNAYKVRVLQGSGVAIRGIGATQVEKFTERMFALGFYQSMVCWPLRSNQNAGTGTTAYSIGGSGIYDGTLVNGPTWGADGITTTTNSQAITSSSLSSTSSPFNIINCSKQNGVSTTTRLYIGTNNGLNRNVALLGGFQQNRGLNQGANNITYTTNQFNFHGWTLTSATTGNLLVNGSITAVTPMFDWDSFANPSPYYIFSHNYISGAADTFVNSFNMAIIGPAITQSQFNSIRSVYKSTMGSGLALP